MTTLADFLLARIAEDEAVARLAESKRDGHLWVVTGMDNAVGVDYDPARVLAECEAKRRIVEAHRIDVFLESCETCFSGDFNRLGDPEHEDYPCATLRALASVYADHDDYREEWRP